MVKHSFWSFCRTYLGNVLCKATSLESGMKDKAVETKKKKPITSRGDSEAEGKWLARGNKLDIELDLLPHSREQG